MRLRDHDEDDGLLFEVGPRDRGCSLEVSPSRRMRWTIGGEPWLWVRTDLYGVASLRRDDETSPHVIPPWRADEARAHTTDRRALVALATALDSSPRSPLFAGTWRLELARRPSDAEPLGSRTTNLLDVFGLEAAPSMPALRYDDWGAAGSNRVVLSRRPSSANAPRVKAWRKHVRDGTLPPILLTYVTGWCTHLLLDGHDRLVAALAEGELPRVAMLWRANVVSNEPPDVETDPFAQIYETALARAAGRAREVLQRTLVERFRPTSLSVESTRARTMRAPAWEAQWDAEVRREAREDAGELLDLELS